MYDRIVRHELIESDAFVDLRSDTQRLLSIALRLAADDFGNVEGNLRRVFRWVGVFTQIKTTKDLAAAIAALVEKDLARQYEVEGRKFLHLPKFRSHRTYRRRLCPPSPWCTGDAPTGPYKAGFRQQARPKSCAAGPDENSPTINDSSAKSDSELVAQVGVVAAEKNDPLPLPEPPACRRTGRCRMPGFDGLWSSGAINAAR